MTCLTEEEKNKIPILQGRYDLTAPECALIKRGLLLAESLGKPQVSAKKKELTLEQQEKVFQIYKTAFLMRLAGKGLLKKEYICPILKVRFALIPAGTFMMGSHNDEKDRDDDEIQHQVTIRKPFYLQVMQVTQGDWKKLMGSNPSYFKGNENLPVEQVSWNYIQEFIQKLNKMEETVKYRLPTEAEWEYACRAGSTTAYCFGDEPARLGEYAWFDDHMDAGDEPTHIVGQKKPNAWGLYDMHGNVWEWCQDWWGVYPSGCLTDPVGPLEGSCRVLRGGCCGGRARVLRSAKREGLSPDGPYDSGEGEILGFRLVREL